MVPNNTGRLSCTYILYFVVLYNNRKKVLITQLLGDTKLTKSAYECWNFTDAKLSENKTFSDPYDQSNVSISSLALMRALVRGHSGHVFRDRFAETCLGFQNYRITPEI